MGSRFAKGHLGLKAPGPRSGRQDDRAVERLNGRFYVLQEGIKIMRVILDCVTSLHLNSAWNMMQKSAMNSCLE